MTKKPDTLPELKDLKLSDTPDMLWWIASPSDAEFIARMSLRNRPLGDMAAFTWSEPSESEPSESEADPL